MARTKAEAGKPNKTDMVKSAIKELGADTGPKDMSAWIQKTYSTEIPPTMVSSYKSNILKKMAGGGGGSGRKAAGGGGGDSVSIKDIHTVRDLLDRHGPAGLQSLVKLLNK